MECAVKLFNKAFLINSLLVSKFSYLGSRPLAYFVLVRDLVYVFSLVLSIILLFFTSVGTLSPDLFFRGLFFRVGDDFTPDSELLYFALSVDTC